MSAHALVCLQDLQVQREIFPVFLTKGRLTYILHLQKCPFLPFVTSRNDVNDTFTLCHLFCFWHNLVRFNVRKDVSPLRNLRPLLSSKITKNSIRIAMTRKSVHGTRICPPIVFISPAIEHWVYNK